MSAYVARENNDVRHEARSIAQFVRQDVVCRSRRIARHDNRGGNVAYGEEARDNDDRVQPAGHPAFGALFQCGDVLSREVEAHSSAEKCGRFEGVNRVRPRWGNIQFRG